MNLPGRYRPIDLQATDATRRRYQRNAPFYDLMEIMARKRFLPWRTALWRQVRGPRILEAGIGTGRNIPFYPVDIQVTGIDLTPGMLARAQQKAARLNRAVDLRLGDLQELEFPDAAFDEAVATCVFCSVPDPVAGLAELRRVVKPGGRILLLEHVLSSHPTIAKIMNRLNPLVVRMMGANINRNTLENIRRSGLHLDRVEYLDPYQIFLLIQASVPESRSIQTGSG